MDKKNLLVIGALLLLAAVLLTVTLLNRPMTAVEEDTVIITINGEEYARVPLAQPQTVTVAQDNGCVNVVEVSDHGAVMLSSTCDNQDCVDQGEVHIDTYMDRILSTYIICLPNNVSIEMVPVE